MQICETRPDKKHQVKITFVGGHSVLVDKDYFAELCIKTGDDLSEEQIKEILKQSDYVRAKSRALWYLDRGALSCKGLAEKLKRAGFSSEAIERVIDRFCELSLLDDYAYATRLAEKCAEAGMSELATRTRLYEKGVPRDIIKTALESTEFDDGEAIKTVIAKKYAVKLQNGETEKVYAALVRRGFSYSAVKKALRLTRVEPVTPDK